MFFLTQNKLTIMWRLTNARGFLTVLLNSTTWPYIYGIFEIKHYYKQKLLDFGIDSGIFLQLKLCFFPALIFKILMYTSNVQD